MVLDIKVVRHRMSVTQGEAEVIVNGKSIVRYGDNIVPGGEINPIGGWGSDKPDSVFIAAALRQYSKEIAQA